MSQFPPTNQVTLYRYDEEGNRTRKVIYITSDPDPVFPGGELDKPPSGWDLIRDEFYLRGADGLEFAVYNSYDLEYYNVWAGNENIAKITSGNEVQHYIKDHLGSIRVTVDENNVVLSAQDGVYPDLPGILGDIYFRRGFIIRETQPISSRASREIMKRTMITLVRGIMIQE